MIRIAVVGAGHWGPNLIRNFDNKLTSEVAWVVDRDAKRLEQVKARFPAVQLAQDIEPALHDPRVDAVVISTPTSTHYPLVKAALGAGKHVLVEKPVATESHQGAELLELAEKAGRILMVGHLFLFNAGVRKVKQYLESGALGTRLLRLDGAHQPRPIRMDVNAAWDLASHDVSIANYWLGASRLTVSAVGGSWINRGIEDAVFATLRYPGDVLVTLHVSWLNPRKSRDITVVGERKMITPRRHEPHRAARAMYDKFVTDDRTTAASWTTSRRSAPACARAMS
jgi:predicted dehydrogenase